MNNQDPDHIDTFKGILLGAAIGAAFYLFVIFVFSF
jgi:hypothetical protein